MDRPIGEDGRRERERIVERMQHDPPTDAADAASRFNAWLWPDRFDTPPRNNFGGWEKIILVILIAVLALSVAFGVAVAIAVIRILWRLG